MTKPDFDIKVLDMGYVKYIDHMGTDEGVIEAARMSTGRGFEGWDDREECKVCGSVKTEDNVTETCRTQAGVHGGGMVLDIMLHEPHQWKKKSGDRNLLDFLYRHKHCYDRDTEVLTDSGFVKWPDVTESMLLGCWDPEAGSLVYEKARGLVSYDHDGDMYMVRHGGVDLLVTPNHSMFVKTKEWRETKSGSKNMVWTDKYRLIQAEELGDRSMVRYCKVSPYHAEDSFDGHCFPEHDDPKALLRLIGFFIGDGNATGTYANAITFHLKKRRKINYLKEICACLGWELVENASDVFAVCAVGVAKAFREQFYTGTPTETCQSGDKRIPESFARMNLDESSCLLDGLRNSDGSLKRGAWEFSTSVSAVAEAVQRIALHAGEAAHLGKSVRSDGYTMHRVMFLSRMREPVINQGRTNTSITHYRGTVYCATTRTGVLVVRRGGKIVLSGNSTPFEMCELQIEVQAPIMVFREWHRHRTQSVNEFSARYSVMPNMHYVPEPSRFQPSKSSNKQESSAVAVDDVPAAQEFLGEVSLEQSEIYSNYQHMLANGVPKEVARINTPVSRYSKMRAKTDLRNWLGFLNLRMRPNAQYEIRVYADAVASIIKQLWPRTYALFEEYDLYGVHMSRTEMQLLRLHHSYGNVAWRDRAEQIVELNEDERILDSESRMKEFLRKLSDGGRDVL